MIVESWKERVMGNLGRKHRLTLIVFLSAVFVSAVILVDRASQIKLPFPTEYPLFSRLHEIYESEGIAAFLREKEILQRQVARTLQKGDEPMALQEAANIALYMFPDLLSGRSFEKDEAFELWVPIQERIEASPGTLQSREWFEELRANVWNFENPDRTDPKVTPHAQQMIRIYDSISAKGVAERE